MAAALLATLMLYGCGDMKEVEQRSDYWQIETSLFIRGHVTLDELHTWLREHEVVYTFDDSDIVDGNWRIIVETVRPKSFRCEFVHIILNVQLDPTNVIQSFYFDFDGGCLW